MLQYVCCDLFLSTLTHHLSSPSELLHFTPSPSRLNTQPPTNFFFPKSLSIRGETIQPISSSPNHHPLEVICETLQPISFSRNQHPLEVKPTTYKNRTRFIHRWLSSSLPNPLSCIITIGACIPLLCCDIKTLGHCCNFWLGFHSPLPLSQIRVAIGNPFMFATILLMVGLD